MAEIKKAMVLRQALGAGEESTPANPGWEMEEIVKDDLYSGYDVRGFHPGSVRIRFPRKIDEQDFALN